MKEEKELSKRKARLCCAVLLLVEFGVLLYLISGYTKEKTVVNIPYTDFIGTTIPDDRGGWYVDASFPLEPSGIFDYTPDMPLKKGTYDITVRYETDTENNTCSVAASTKGFWGLRADTLHLSPRTQEMTFMIYLYEDVEDFEFRTYFGREGYLIIKGVTITETRAALRIQITVALFLFILLDLFLLGKYKGWFDRISIKSWYRLLALSAVTFAVSYPLFSGYITSAIDLNYHLMRIDGIAEGLLAGQFPVRIQPNWMYGHGYPASVFYGDLFLYFPAILRLIGFSTLFAYSVFMVVCNFATAGIAYWCFRKIAREETIGMLAAFLYVSAPYRMTNLYIRGDVGETWGMVFLPLLVYGMYAVFSDKEAERYEKLWIPLVIGFSGVLQTHILSGALYGGFVLLACVVYVRKIFGKGHLKTFLVLAKTVVYTTLLNAGFLFPCLTAMHKVGIGHISNEAVHIQTWGAHISQLFNLFYPGNGDSYMAPVGTYREMAYGIGFTLGGGLLLYLLAVLHGREHGKKVKGGAFFAFTLLALWMTTLYFPWDWISEHIPFSRMVIANIQFATRFSTLATVLAAATIIFALRYFQSVGNIKKLCAVVFAFGLIGCFYMLDNRIHLINGPMLMDTASIGKSDYFCNVFAYPGTDLELLNSAKTAAGEHTVIVSYRKKYLTVSMEVENASEFTGWVEVPLLYNDWYVCEIDGGGAGGKKAYTEVSLGENNVVRAEIPAGYCGPVSIYFKEPLTWRLSEIVSLFTLLGLVLIEFVRRKGLKIKMPSARQNERKIWQKS